MTQSDQTRPARPEAVVPPVALAGRYAATMTAIAVVIVAALFVKPGPPGWPVWAFLAGTASWMAIRIWFEARSGRTHDVRDPLERRLLFAVLVGMVVMPFFHIATPVFGFADLALPAALHWLGVVLAVAGIVLLYRSHSDLQRYWSPSLALVDDHALVETGVYRRIRHPMYSALFLLTFAQACLLDNWLAGLSGLATFATLYVMRIGREEAMMRERFAERWDLYAARTFRLFPRWRQS